MRTGNNSHGYTIVEVLIFLAISGFMFTTAAIFISGKQSKSEFKQGINDINTQVQQVISDVGNGFYPSNSDFQCSISGTGPTLDTTTTKTQGGNKNCVFMGKVVQFGVADASGTAHRENFNVYSVIGRQYKDASLTIPANFVDSTPRIAYFPPVDLTQSQKLQWGAQVTKMYEEGSPNQDIGAVGFFGSFSSTNGASLQSGAQSVTAVALPSSGLDQKKDGQVTTFNAANYAAQLDTAALNDPNPSIVLCLDGGSGQYGTLRIGSSAGQRLATKLQIYNSLPSNC